MLARIVGLLALALAASAAGAVPRVATDIAPVQSIAARVMGRARHPRPHPAAGRLAARLRAAPLRSAAAAGRRRRRLGRPRPHALARRADRRARPRRRPGHPPGRPRRPAPADPRGRPFAPTTDDHGRDHDHDEHAHGAADGHLWLDPANAVAAARAIAAALGAADPANAAAYAANAEAFAAEADGLAAAIDARLAPVRGRPFIVFHDCLQYFEHRFAFPAAGSVALQEGAAPSAERVAALRDRVQRRGHRLRLRRAAVRAEAARHRHRGHRGAHRRPRPDRRRPAARPRPLPRPPPRPRRRPRRLPRPLTPASTLHDAGLHLPNRPILRDLLEGLSIFLAKILPPEAPARSAGSGPRA